MRSFCTISASTFWKIQPDIYIYIVTNQLKIWLGVTPICLCAIIYTSNGFIAFGNFIWWVPHKLCGTKLNSNKYAKPNLELICHFLYIYIYTHKFTSCHNAIMVVTGGTHCSILLYIMLQIHSVEHSYGLGGESLRETFTIYIYASLIARSLSTLVTPQCNPTMCNRTSCAQVHELP